MKLKEYLLLPLVIPHIICFWVSKKKPVITADMKRWGCIRKYANDKKMILSLICLLSRQKDFRAQFYLRLGRERALLKLLLRPVDCDIERDVFGEGLMIIHGYGVVVNCGAKIGKNCTIYHGVTIGNTDWYSTPTIGDNVFIGTGAKILGNIHIGNNVKIGAGAIVVDDVPDNSTIVGPKAFVVKHH